MTDYTRVLPRDLFNEAKLLKCVGKLCLAILDNQAPMNLKHFDLMTTGFKGFVVSGCPDGAISISNLVFTVSEVIVPFRTTQNSKANYPLHAWWENCEILVFDEDGDFTAEFLEFCENI